MGNKVNHKKHIILVIIFVATFVQVMIFISDNLFNTNEMQKNEIVDEKLSLKELDDELKSYGNITILEQQRVNNSWNCSIDIEGSKEEIIETINMLSKYKILNYKINGNGENFYINMEIIR